MGSRRSGANATIADKAAFFSELKGYATLRGYNDGWASHKYRERFGVWPNDPRVRCARPTPPSLKTKNWIISRQIAFAKAKERVLMAKSKRRRAAGANSRLHDYMLKTDAWKAPSAASARSTSRLAWRYGGFDNGKIILRSRRRERVRPGENTASRTFKELLALGFIEATRHRRMSR